VGIGRIVINAHNYLPYLRLVVWCVRRAHHKLHLASEPVILRLEVIKKNKRPKRAPVISTLCTFRFSTIPTGSRGHCGDPQRLPFLTVSSCVKSMYRQYSALLLMPSIPQ